MFDQTVREIKREVNLKVLKVPEIEQKVLDATDDEPWGPHGTALAEIAQATKKFSECQMVMNVLWTRLTETGKNWRFVYKALAVIEYLVAHGSERAVDDIIEHTFQISSLASFEYVEPSGKDLGINVRKKAENIVALLNDKDKIQELRNKAAKNRDKYFGLSSSGITNKSGSGSFTSGSSQSSSRYGGFGSEKDDDDFNVRDRYGDDKSNKGSSFKSRQDSASNLGNVSRKGSSRIASKGQETRSTGPEQYPSIPSQSSTTTPANNYDDDFDPRGSSHAKPSTETPKQVDLFEQNLFGDFLDVPIATEKSATQDDSSEVDLFADAAFVSATSPSEARGSSGGQKNADLFASQPATLGEADIAQIAALQPAPLQKNVYLFPSEPTSATSSTMDFFSAPNPVTRSATNSDSNSASTADPFAAIPITNFDSSDPFGAFTQSSGNASSMSNSIGSSVETKPISNSNGSTVEIKPAPKKDAFQVKSGIWADSLSRGIIDLNITAPKKVNLADVGIVGGLSDPFDDRDKGSSTSFYMGGTIGSGSAFGKPGYNSAASGADDFFSIMSSQQYQFGGYKK